MIFRYKETKELSIIMPCLNEEKTVGACIKKAQEFLRTNQINGEVIVSDNGSSDRSCEIAKSMGARLVHEKRRGYGRAIRTGMEHSKGHYIVLLDCDLTYDFSDIGKIYYLLAGVPAFKHEQTLDNDNNSCIMPDETKVTNRNKSNKHSNDSLKKNTHYDMVIGNRFAGKTEQGAMAFSHRLGSSFLSALGRWRFGVEIVDFHCGLRGVTREAASCLEFRTTGMEFATEMIALAGITDFHGRKMRLAQVPVNLRRGVKGRSSKLKPVRDGVRHLRYILHLTKSDNYPIL